MTDFIPLPYNGGDRFVRRDLVEFVVGANMQAPTKVYYVRHRRSDENYDVKGHYKTLDYFSTDLSATDVALLLQATNPTTSNKE